MPRLSRFLNQRAITAAALSVAVTWLSVGSIGAATYGWPIRNVPKDPSSLWSSLGEVRSEAGDAPNWLSHGATDFKSEHGTQIYACDVGRVRFGEQSDKPSGMPPVKIGHFSYLHFRDATNLPVDSKVLGDEKLWTWVVNPDDPIVLTPGGAPTSLAKEKKGVVKGVRQDAGGAWEAVFYYSINLPIGEASGPDVHVIHYASADCAYDDRAQIRNALSVLEYQNGKEPEIHHVRLFSQAAVNGQAKELLWAGQGGAAMSIINHGGVDVTVTTSEFHTGKAESGIYEVAYSVHRLLTKEEALEPPPNAEAVPGMKKRKMVPSRPRAVMFTYDSMPTKAIDTQLIARRTRYPLPGVDISSFNAVDREKYTAYVVTNTAGDDASHWELEDVTRFPDGDYVLTVDAKGIAKSNGMGAAPQLSQTIVRYHVSVATTGDTRRLRVRRI